MIGPSVGRVVEFIDGRLQIVDQKRSPIHNPKLRLFQSPFRP